MGFTSLLNTGDRLLLPKQLHKLRPLFRNLWPIVRRFHLSMQQTMNFGRKIANFRAYKTFNLITSDKINNCQSRSLEFNWYIWLFLNLEHQERFLTRIGRHIKAAIPMTSLGFLE